MSAERYFKHFADYPEVLAAVGGVTFTESGCWQFPTASYPTRIIAGRRTSVHRLSLEIAQGKPLDELLARHRCDNPPCCNPEHLEPGTPADNSHDMALRGRARNKVMRGEEHPRARPINQVREARDLYLTGDWTFKALAERFEVSIFAVSTWIRGQRSDAGESIFRERPPIRCGTFPGYQRHRRRGEKPCEPCRQARLAYRREREYA